MSTLALPTYQQTERTAATLGALAMLPASIRITDLLIHKVGTREFIACIVATLASYYVATRVEKSSALTEKSLSVLVSVCGCRILSKKTDISNAAWVRARNTGSHYTEIVIEVGTNGYKTTELCKLPYKFGEGIPQAEEWCERIASYLGLPSKGYRGKA
jgi:hypothetical protein